MAARDRYAIARGVLSQIAHPVAIVAAASGEERSCATATLMYVSHDPPLVAVALHPGGRTTELLRASKRFSASLLTASQQDRAEAAGRSFPGPDKFAEAKIPTLDAPAGFPPGVAGSIAVLWCEVRDERPTGDHVLFTGEVTAHHVDETRSMALLRFRRRYARLGHDQSDESPEGYPT